MACEEFYDLHHIQAYLCDSIVRYNGVPIYIRAVGVGTEVGRYTLMYCDLAGARDDRPVMKYCNYPNEAIDLTPVPLGLVNLKEGIAHVSRMPHRQWKVGMTPRNMTHHLLNHNSLNAQMSARHLPFCKEMEDTIIGRYPSLDDIMGQKKPLGAFSRRFAIMGNQLAYRTRTRVGRMVNGVPILDEKYFYLNEVLTEDLYAQGKDDLSATAAA